ncbi:hypothetical protein JJL45_07160 [Tamlana sp. s12]|uniref:hypothetical protein n=1 Tax=Tamlana sp. s12 TaxID=1630406 RepID=UPI0007FD5D38|nr:hypothetical protein [Tamlana sp. s12]OBQ55568.1 hypothetical protein VQ01_08985 [Tamlana sp. s12]QQY83758.1 hypothetical protein JJL45_07160 [Tamlana sp. s12]
MVKEYELGGIQHFADNVFKSKFIKDYAISDISKFILLDLSENIVSENAPRSSSLVLMSLFNNLDI